MKMNNNSKFRSKKIINFVKFIFHISNIILIIFYLYPGSIFGCFLYNDCKTQPQLTPDFIVSSNHVYVFTIISLLGFMAYAKNKAFTIIISYFFFYSDIFRISTYYNSCKRISDRRSSWKYCWSRYIIDNIFNF